MIKAILLKLLKAVEVGDDMLCRCTASDLCPHDGRCGQSPRCTAGELLARGFVVYHKQTTNGQTATTEREHMKAYQKSVGKDKAVLDANLESLAAFIDNSSEFKELSEEEQTLLIEQRSSMATYSDILGERIRKFI